VKVYCGFGALDDAPLFFGISDNRDDIVVVINEFLGFLNLTEEAMDELWGVGLENISEELESLFTFVNGQSLMLAIAYEEVYTDDETAQPEEEIEEVSESSLVNVY